MSKRSTPRQLVPLKAWAATHPKKTDPRYSGRLLFNRALVEYLMANIEAEEEPELFLSLWINEGEKHAHLGLAVPREWVHPENRSKREDFESWMD